MPPKRLHLKNVTFFILQNENTMNLDLTNKQAIVCGSTQGIGKASAIELALLGANITLIARNECSLQKTITDLDISQGQVHDYIVADFSEPETLLLKVQEYVKKKKQVHILVNNTGGPAGGLAINAKISEFEAAFSAHLICNHYLVQTFVPLMKECGYGRIINIISTSVKAPLQNLGVSNTIRGAVASWAKTLAGELASFGITVNNVLPGATSTARLESIIKNKAEKQGVSIVQSADAMKSVVPSGRFATPEEVGATVAFLASPSAAYINGINLPVDGGRLACL